MTFTINNLNIKLGPRIYLGLEFIWIYAYKTDFIESLYFYVSQNVLFFLVVK